MKQQFKRDILKGSTLPLDGATAKAVTEEFFTYRKPETVNFSSAGRRMNHYMLGADPEFMFVTAPEYGGEVVHATHMGLRSALAFGADQNDRLVELRPAPSRSALEVLGSTLSELRWLYRYLAEAPDASRQHWIANAFHAGDGMGGHVHFGRKRSQRADEVAGLDGLAKTMRSAGMFDTVGWNRRSQGDQFHQVYGAYGDIRIQKHGYEYRTLPTWLDNPRLGFLVLTLTKLIVLDPDITAKWDPTSAKESWKKMQGLAKYYMGRDDDALLLYSMMDNAASFRFQGGDFKERWGLTGKVAGLPAGFVIPGFIEATKEDTADLYTSFTEGTGLRMRETQATWKTQVPEGYSWVPLQIEYRRRPNIGDILYDLVQHSDFGWHWNFDHSRDCVIYCPPWYDSKRLNAERGGIKVSHSNESRFHIRVGHDWRKGTNLAHLRKVLLSGLLPLWSVDSVKQDSHKAFSQQYRSKKVGKYSHAGLVGAA
jgi:hypothetical protein